MFIKVRVLDILLFLKVFHKLLAKVLFTLFINFIIVISNYKLWVGAVIFDNFFVVCIIKYLYSLIELRKDGILGWKLFGRFKFGRLVENFLLFKINSLKYILLSKINLVCFHRYTVKFVVAFFVKNKLHFGDH